MLFVPADRGQFVENAARRGADALILDLEDGVAAAAKAVARANLATFVPKLRAAGVPVYVRVNPDAALRLTDLEASIAAGADGVLAPKIECADDVLVFDAEIGRFEARLGKPAGSTALIALIESPRALGNITAIAQASARVEALLFGPEDFAAAMGIEPTPQGLAGPAQAVAIAAVAAGLQPLGLPGSVAGFTDLVAYREIVRCARAIGMQGTVCIHPAQVAVANEVFGGSADEAERARRLLKAFDAAAAQGRGAVAHEGRMVDQPVALRARKFLQRYDALQRARERVREAAP